MPSGDLLDGCRRSSWKLALAMESWHVLALTWRVHKALSTGHHRALPNHKVCSHFIQRNYMKLAYLDKSKRRFRFLLESPKVLGIVRRFVVLSPRARSRHIVLTSDYTHEPSIDAFHFLVGGFEHDFYFPRYWGQSSQLTNIFQRVSNHQPDLSI